MTTPSQEQLTSVDHQYFDWSTSKQQTNLHQPLMTHTNRRHHYEDKQFKSNTSPVSLSPISHIKKKQKRNGKRSNDEQNQSQTCYPFQAELTQKIDIECGGSGGGGNNSSNGLNQITHTPTHHFTLSTVINVSVNGQTQKSLDILPSPSQQQSDFHVHSSSSLIPYSELNFSLYLKDLDLTTLDTFILPLCPNPQDYLTADGLLTFLMSDKNLSKQYPLQQMYLHPRTQHHQYPYQQYQMSQYYNNPLQNLSSPCLSSTPMEIGTSSSYRQSSLPQSMTNYYSTITPNRSFR